MDSLGAITVSSSVPHPARSANQKNAFTGPASLLGLASRYDLPDRGAGSSGGGVRGRPQQFPGVDARRSFHTEGRSCPGSSSQAPWSASAFGLRRPSRCSAGPGGPGVTSVNIPRYGKRRVFGTARGHPLGRAKTTPPGRRRSVKACDAETQRSNSSSAAHPLPPQSTPCPRARPFFPQHRVPGSPRLRAGS